ncbi:MAG: phenylalanine--tRNA ligase subunit alpha, partial [bacterium]|nr:phenylalanine--tRNA ligase subunit alpha [bacterium]
NEVKGVLERLLAEKRAELSRGRMADLEDSEWIDVTAPGQRPPSGHLNPIAEAIRDITAIFERIGFIRVRHPEVDSDYYAFEALNMPPDHPARDEWETFFVKPEASAKGGPASGGDSRKHQAGRVVLTPHTSNGQVREMEKGVLPIRMINIGKCYRRQIDATHTPMFHQFEGLLIDRNIAVTHLKGTLDSFVASYFGPGRRTRLRPYHFQFTEPSFEIDISCAVCGGSGIRDGGKCTTCKSGWLELGGAGMVHPNVLRAGGIDSEEYSGFAFGWGVERVLMMRAGLSDIRLLYNNDLRWLHQW